MSNIHAALEIGTTRTVLAIGEADGAGRLRLTAHAEIPSSGIRKSVIQDIAAAKDSIHSVLAEIERTHSGKDSITIGNAMLIVSGRHVESSTYREEVQVENARISTDDIREVLENSKSRTLQRDRELLDIVEQDYIIDNSLSVLSPKGMSARSLALNTLHLHADRHRIQDARTAAEASHIEIREPVFAATCAAEAVLEEPERHQGALVLDLGGGSTGYAAYANGYLVAAGVIGVGGDHISSDIAHAFQLSHTQSEDLKLQSAAAILRHEDAAEERVQAPGSSVLMDSRTFSRRALNTVVNVRIRELMAILRERLGEALLPQLHAGAVLTGGGAALRDIDALIQRELGIPVRIGRPINIDGTEELEHSERYAAITGALLYAHRNLEEKPLLPFGDLFGRFFK